MSIMSALGSKFAGDYKKQFAWTEKSGDELNNAALQWHTKGRQSDFEAKPEGWLSREEMTSQIGDLNKRYDALKIDYDKLAAGPQQQRDQHGGYGEQTTKVDNIKIAQDQAAQSTSTTKKKTSSAPKPTQTYTGSASL